MPRNDSLPPLVSTIQTPVSVIDRQALRATLRLVLPAQVADEAAGRLPFGGDLVDLSVVARDALGRARLEDLLARLPWQRHGDTERLLGPASGASAEAAVMLAFGVGLGLSGRDLADVFDIRIEQVGETLVVARRSIAPDMPDPCRKTAFLVGFHNDRSLDPDERLELITHLQRCPTCRIVVERSRAVDAIVRTEHGRLLAIVSGQPMGGASRLDRTRRAALLAGLVALLAIGLVAGSAVLGQLFGNEHEPVALLAHGPSVGRRGWVLMARPDGSALARNLTTGETRQIVGSSVSPNGSNAELTLSPDGTRVLSSFREFSQPSVTRAVAYDLGGRVVGTLEWMDDRDVAYPSGWIDERRILVSIFPVHSVGESNSAFLERFANESVLLAVDIETGATTDILRGNVAYGVPSPDGRYVAALRMTGQTALVADPNGITLEVRAVGQTASEPPIVTVDNWVVNGSSLIWADDGSYLFTTQEIESDEPASVPDAGQQTTPGSVPHALVAIGIDGTTTRLVEAGGGIAMYPVSAAPDGSSIVYQRVEMSGVLPTSSYWIVSRNGGEPRQLSGAITQSYGDFGVVWSPDGTAILLSEVVSPYLSPNATEWSRFGPSTTETIVVEADGTRTTVLSSFSVGDRLLGWLPEDAVSRTIGDGDPRFARPENVQDVPDWTRIGATSAASANGRYITLEDLAIGSPLVWKVGTNDTQRLRGSLDDAIWLPGATSVLTVSGGSLGSESASRLAILASTNPYAPFAFEPQEFDPAGLGGDPTRRYAAPHVSGDGLNTSFFVVAATRVELWVANAAGAVRVTSWNLPGGRMIEPPLAADWVDGRTLVFVEPRGWRRGLPEVGVLRRMVVAPDGSATVEDVIELNGRGNDKGIALQEIAISSDGSEIAWRMRHYSEWRADDGRVDTIVLAPVDDLTSDVELERGSPGSGLMWSPDRQWLLAGIDQGVVLIDAADLRVRVIPSDETAQNPIWVGADEIWFAAGDSATVMRVRVE